MTKPNTGKEETPPSSESCKTKADLRLHGGRERVSIRVKPELKEALYEFAKANGLSLCHIFEMLSAGYLTGMKQKINWVSQSPTIELTVVRDVKRVRRYVREPNGGRDVFTEDHGDSCRCFVCGESPTWRAGSWTDSFHYVRTWLCDLHFVKEQWMKESKNWCRLGRVV